MTMLRLLSVTMVLMAAIAVSRSYPTLYGETGLVLVPTADTIPDTFVELALNYATAETPGGDAILFPARLLYGASDNNELFIIFAESITDTADGGFDTLGAGFKVSLKKEDLFTQAPGFAFGARLYQKHGFTSQRALEAYAVASKILLKRTDLIDDSGYTFRGHLAGFFSRFTGDPAEENFWSLAAGFSYENFNGTAVVIDYVPKLESNGVMFRDAELSFAVRRALSREFFIEAGTTQPFNEGSGGNIYAGLLYRWGTRDEPIRKRPRIEGMKF